MIQIIQERKKPSGKEKFAQAMNNVMERGANMASEYGQAQKQREMQDQENARLKELTGKEFSGLTPELKKLAFQEVMKGKGLEQEYGLKSQAKGDELAGKKQENLAPFQAGLQTVDQMRKIRKRGNLGRGSSIIGAFGGQTAKDRGTYETLGKSLISLASNIPIRNKAEFETLAEKLYDPSITDSEAEGVLDAMENIIKRSAKQYQGQEEMGMQGQGFSSQNLPSFGQSQQQRPPLSQFMR